jgi:hypothetical protein
MAVFLSACLLRHSEPTLRTYTKIEVATMTESWIDTVTTAYEGQACVPCSPVGEVSTVTNFTAVGYDFTAVGYAGMISATVNVNPFIAEIVGSYLNVELPLGVTVNRDFQGYVPITNNLAQWAADDISDGEIKIDFPLISNVFGLNPDTSVLDLLGNFGITVPNSVLAIFDALDITDANSAIEVVDNLFDVELAGSGTLTSVTEATNFNFEYLGEENTFLIDGFDPTVVAGSLVGTSTITAEGDFSVDLVISEFVNLTKLLGIDLPSTVDILLASAQIAGINEIELASGSFSLDMTTVPVSDPLAGYTDLLSATCEPTLCSGSVVI